MNIWFLVADASRARIFETTTDNKKAPLNEIMDLADPNARIRQTELASDGPGRNATAGGHGTHGMQEKITPREQEDIRFAADICKELQDKLNQGRFGRLYIAAAPRFLGLLRNGLPSGVKSKVAGDLDKDLTRFGESEIREHLHRMM